MKDCFKVINVTNLRKNIDFLKKNLKNSKLCAVVKSDAYGHGIDKICSLIANNIDYFAVSNNDEAIQVKYKHPLTQCLILSPVSRDNLREAILRGAIFSVQNERDLKILNNTAKKLNKIAFYHLQINSGMNRFGLSTKSDINSLLRHKFPYTYLNGIYSHFGSGESENDTRAKKQLGIFKLISSDLPPNIIRHFCNSQNTLTHPEAHFDMVRCGLAIYGYGNKNLTPVMSIFAKIIAIQNVQAGDYIGYGLEHKITRPTKIATISIGYAKGLPRLWAKEGFVLVNKQKAKILGNICMEATFIDIGNIPAKIGDYVTVLSDLPTLNANTIANSCQTIPYEILTNFRNIPLK